LSYARYKLHYIFALISMLWCGDVIRAESSVASAHPAATFAGKEILDAGGNAFDAAIAVAAALAVVEPYSSGIGGGGFFLLHTHKDGTNLFVDAREEAPSKATADMYLDSSGDFIRERSLNGPLAAAIPGLPAGLVYLSENFANLTLHENLAPAIRLAREGFLTGDRYEKMAGYRVAALRLNKDAANIFLDEGNVPKAGFRVIQEDLAETLESIAVSNGESFYGGDLARRMVNSVVSDGGIWRIEDLKNYEVKIRQPLVSFYHDVKIISSPPPSSGGVALIEALNILERYDLEKYERDTYIHLVVEAMRRAYRDRADYLGDPDFVKVPVKELSSKAHADLLASSISDTKATPSSSLPQIGSRQKGSDTTHFSIVDSLGNRVAATLSINIPFGAAMTAVGTGVLLNNEMDDFSAKPFTPNTYGLVGANANSIAPGKRPLSSMTPTFLEGSDRIAIMGTPGGSRIISMVLISALDFIMGATPAEMVSSKRFHHQYLPDQVYFEKDGLTLFEKEALSKKGHKLKESSRNYGNMQVIVVDKVDGSVDAASDPRGEGSSVVW
jgi:gamma-glutamyltranspeptidase/glutathione hydrolase